MKYFDYYYHATGGFKGTFSGFNRVKSIFYDGKISVDRNVGCIDYTISQNKKRNYLCDRSMPYIEGFDSSFDLYISYSPSLVLKKDFDVIVPLCSTKKADHSVEITDLYDEVRTDKDIPLIHLVALCIPITKTIQRFEDEYNNIWVDDNIFLKDVAKKDLINAYEYKINFFKKAYIAAKRFNNTLNIIDLSTEEDLDESAFYYLEEIIHNKDDKNSYKLNLVK
ncbi:MAG: hypothetical protein GX758_01485 [Tenericutes bacterium]|nr:hypothetical protein [Mycoplasmatota bacterium]